MRCVAGWMGVLWLVAGCTVPDDVAKVCSSDADCAAAGGFCDLNFGICYGEEPEIPITECTPSCAVYQACTATGCKPRFTGLTIQSPVNNALLTGGTVEVKVQLQVDPAYAATTTYPETISFIPTREDGGPVGSFTTATRDGTGDVYTAQWTLPTGQSTITLTASYPAASVQSLPVTVRLDTQAPTFTIMFSNPPTRATGTAGTQADERDPTSGYDTAFRRDETVTVTVVADEAVSGVTLTVVGIGAGGNPGQEMPVAVQPGSTCGGNPPFCGTATVDLSTPEMRDTRGTMDFRVEGQDAAGNKGSSPSGLRVTRWKWVFDAGVGISGSPAVGNRGTIFFGINTFSSTGKTLAVGANGSKKWEAPSGDVVGNVAVGALASNEEYVYVAGKTSAGAYLYALVGSSGAERYHCGPYANAFQLQGSLAVGIVTFGADTAETASGIYETTGSQTRIAGIRPDGASKCIDTSNVSSPVPISVAGGSYVMKDQNIFYGTNGDNPGTRVTSYDLGSGSNTPRFSWPVSTVDLARGLALAGDKLYIASSGTSASSGDLSSVQVTGGALTKVYPASGGSRVFNLAIGNGNTAYFGAETSSGSELVALALDTGSPVRVSSGTLRGAPIVGKNNRIYTLDTQGNVTVWSLSPLAPVWSVNLALALSSKDVSPTVDCRRDASGTAVAGPGTLYVAGDKKLYALITDDAGMNPNAPWPKFQHDARNTGNPATPITNCP